MDVNGFLILCFFYKKSSKTSKGTRINSDVFSENKQKAKELHEPIITKNEKCKVYSIF